MEKDFYNFSDFDLTLIKNNDFSFTKEFKQRINLARALYLNPDIYFIDEGLNLISEKILIKIFNEGFINDKTVIFTSKSAKFAVEIKPSKICVVNNCQVVEFDKVENLIENSCSELNRMLIKQGIIDKLNKNEEEKEKEDIWFNNYSINKEKNYKDHETIYFKKKGIKDFNIFEGKFIGKLIWEYFFKNRENNLALFIICFCGFLFSQIYFIGNLLTIAFLSDYNFREKIHYKIYFLCYFIVLILIISLLIFVKSYILGFLIKNISRKLFEQNFFSIINRKINFFEKNSLIRVMKIFNQDHNVIENQLPISIQYLVTILLDIILMSLLIAVILPYFIIFLIICGYIFAIWIKKYLNNFCKIDEIIKANKLSENLDIIDLIQG